MLARLDNHTLSSDARQMGLDKELVREAARAKEELAVAEHAAYRAKVHYHQAIRRLHAAGGSLREIAEAFRMSHQRVHQIINQAAEATRRQRETQVLSGPVGPCSFCGRPHDVCVIPEGAGTVNPYDEDRLGVVCRSLCTGGQPSTR